MDGTASKKKLFSKKYIWIIIIVSLIFAAFIVPKAIMTVNERLVLDLTVYETDITDFQDGVYSGKYESSHLSASVDVTVVSGLIVSVEITDYTGIDIQRAAKVTDCVVIYQMLNVPDDNIGTEPTDIIVLKSVEYALSGRHQ